MSIISPRTPAGVMELLPREQMAFQAMQDVIRRSFESFGFLPVETPVFEVKDVLLTKSGGETEKQVYFVQSSGSEKQGYDADLALRFDLTVPLARFVAEHERDLPFPFRRYQMQRVYRGERAQKGRFREFYQCDIDVIGKDKLDPIHDAEIPAVISKIFTNLEIGDFTINLSNRKILRGLSASLGLNEDQQTLLLREIDKLDKIGPDKVKLSLEQLGLTHSAIEKILRLITFTGERADVLRSLSAEKIEHPEFSAGVAELTVMHTTLTALNVSEQHARFNLAIARGLDYYTGTVYETFLNAQPNLGSICSGGRYENLAGYYTKSKLPGVGISIGATRLFDFLRSNGWQGLRYNHHHVLIVLMEEQLRGPCLALANQLRGIGLNVETYMEAAKLDKQLRYADKLGTRFCLLLGSEEHANSMIVVKDMFAKTQSRVALTDVPVLLRSSIPL